MEFQDTQLSYPPSHNLECFLPSHSHICHSSSTVASLSGELKTFTSIPLLIFSPEFGTPPAVLQSFILSVAPARSPELILGPTDCSHADPQLKMKETRASNWFWVICPMVSTQDSHAGLTEGGGTLMEERALTSIEGHSHQQ